MEDKIDIHGIERRYEFMIKKLQADTTMNPRNRELLINFVWDCKIGKTVKGRAKKKIGKARILKYIYTLRTLSEWFGKPFDEVTQEEMEKLVADLEEDILKHRQNFTEQTKIDYKKTLKKFYKWLGKPELTEFMDMSIKTQDVPTITRDEAEKMVNSTADYDVKAAIMVLFDGGARAEELLNLRLKDVTKRNYGNSECYWINIRYSKTYARSIPLPLCTKELSEWFVEHPKKDDPEATLFPYHYPALCNRLAKLALKVLKKKLTPHMLRHSSATYWATKMNRYQLCGKYGWAFKSDMPDRYIERKGIIFDQIAEKGDVDQTTKLQKENNILKEKIENLEHDYKRFRKALEYLMPLHTDQVKDDDILNKQTEITKNRLQKLKSSN